MVNTFETNKIPEEEIEKILNSHFDMKTSLNSFSSRPKEDQFTKKTAGYGHFGRNESEFTWEKTDKAEELRKAAGL